MRPFDVLSMDCSIWGPHLLEASAGTGKTFAIEHVFVRLLLESEEMDLEQILVVTFTRAAVRDLKRRIRTNLAEALRRIETENGEWNYLIPYLACSRSIRRLSNSLATFDRCQIFTIHGFCHKILQEFAFETGGSLSLSHPDHTNQVPKKLSRSVRKFLEEKVDAAWISPEQMGHLLKQFDSINELSNELVRGRFGDRSVILPFSELQAQFFGILSSFDASLDEKKLFEDFYKICANYKSVKGDFEAQLKALAGANHIEKSAAALRIFLKEKASLFEFLDPSNQKVKLKEVGPLHYPTLFARLASPIQALVRQAMDHKSILCSLQASWKLAAAPLIAQEGWIDPEDILYKMREALELRTFAAQVRQKYGAVFVDEFQDTDLIQWEILQKLFIESIGSSSIDVKSSLKAMYLVGDPKQSIYRFRRADVYTYLQAKEFLGESALFCLDTNYRSSSKLICALNVLFSRHWLSLPKRGEMMSCPSVKAGGQKEVDFEDHKGALHFMVSSGSFEDSFLPFIALEIERLLAKVRFFSSFALLVKDRYQAHAAKQFFQKKGIPSIARSRQPIGKTLAFQAVRELFDALIFPHRLSLRRLVEAGPFKTLCFTSLSLTLQEKGIASLCRELVSCAADREFCRDLKQVIEELLNWEGREGFSFQGVHQFLNSFEKLESDEGGRRRLEIQKDAVQILTIHVSKGLEFDVVFALGLATSSPDSGDEVEELNAEKLRQLYVAMTRAKQRLYVPLPSFEKPFPKASASPIELFCQTLQRQEGPLHALLDSTFKEQGMTYEVLPSVSSALQDSFAAPSVQEISSKGFDLIPSIPSCFIQSFTSLAKSKKLEAAFENPNPSLSLFTTHTMPRGPETGLVIHRIFQELFSSSIPIWQDQSAVERLVGRRVRFSPLLPWERAIQEMVWGTLNQSLKLDGEAFCLLSLEVGQCYPEMEFLFANPPNFVKGFIDLVFLHKGKIFFLDWKTNWLGEDNAAYVSLDEAMTANDYWLQASLYAQALKRHVKRFYNGSFEQVFGGAVYLFIRGYGVCHFMPAGENFNGN